jgi:hypothetical protein
MTNSSTWAAPLGIALVLFMIGTPCDHDLPS